MKENKRTGLVIAAVGLTVISIFCALTVWGIVNWFTKEGGRFSFVSVDTVKATGYETLTYDSADLTSLEFDLDFSDIEITESEDDQITLELVKTAWASSSEEAEQEVEALTLDTHQRGSTLSFSMPSREPQINVLSIQEHANTIDVNLSVPKDMQISIRVNMGQVNVSGITSDLSVKNDFGNTTIENFDGTLSVDGNNGKITLNTVSLTDPLSLSTDFGDILINGLNAPEISIENQNGTLNLEDLSASGECLLSSDFTDIEVDTISCGSLTIESKNGPIEINHGQIVGPLTITTDFGNLTVKDVTAESYDFTARNGKIFANSLHGAVTVNCDFGDIELYGQAEIVLNIDSQNGNIFFQGVLSPEDDHTIQSDFGSVEVRIPEDSAFDISLSTDFGDIETDFPITLSGNLSNTQVEGEINGGGPLLTIESQNGDITLIYLEN